METAFQAVTGRTLEIRNAPHNTRAIISATSPTGYLNPDTNQPVTRSDVYVVQGVGAPGPGTIGKNTERSKRTNNFDWTLFKIIQRFAKG